MKTNTLFPTVESTHYAMFKDEQLLYLFDSLEHEQQLLAMLDLYYTKGYKYIQVLGNECVLFQKIATIAADHLRIDVNLFRDVYVLWMANEPNIELLGQNRLYIETCTVLNNQHKGQVLVPQEVYDKLVYVLKHLDLEEHEVVRQFINLQLRE